MTTNFQIYRYLFPRVNNDSCTPNTLGSVFVERLCATNHRRQSETTTQSGDILERTRIMARKKMTETLNDTIYVRLPVALRAFTNDTK